MKFVFVTFKEMGFLYKVDSVHWTTEAFFSLLKNSLQALVSFPFLLQLPIRAP